jgi:hypothetical protein
MPNDDFKLLVLDRISEMVEDLAEDSMFLTYLLEDIVDEGLEPDENRVKRIIRELSQEILNG